MTEKEKASLNDYRFTVVSIKAIEKQIALLQIPGGPLGLKNASKKEGGKTNDPTSAAIQKDDGLKELLAEKKTLLQNQTMTFENVLARMTEARDRAILRCYYGLGYSDTQVAAEIGCTRRTAWALRVDALKK